MKCILPGLVSVKAGDEWGWELDCAEKINQVDPTHVEFTLREGLTWSGGFGPVTADDVKYSYERVADPKMESPYADDWHALDHVEVKDERSGVIVLKQPFAPLWFTTLLFGSGRIVSRKAVESVGGKYETKPPAQCGPYKIKEWLPKQKLTLAKNADWNGSPAQWDEIQIMPIDDEKVAELGFESGDLDYTWVAVSSIPRYKETPPKDGKLIVKPSLAYVWLGMNQGFAPFDNPDVRRAVQYGVDVPSVLEAAYFGAAAPATGLIAPGILGHRDKVLYSYDPEKARESLKKAGMSSVDCTLDILNKATNASMAQAIQANLADIGINVTIQPHDSGTFWTLGDEKSGDAWKKVQMIMNRFSMQPDSSFATEWFTPDQIGVWNWERWKNEEFGELHKAALVELDPKKRNEMYIKMQDLMEESGSYVFLTHEATGLVHRTSIAPALQPDGRPLLSEFKSA